MTWQTFIRSASFAAELEKLEDKISLCLCGTCFIDHDNFLAVRRRATVDAFRRGSLKWPFSFFRFILAFLVLSDCPWVHTAPPVINAIASNAAVTHKQASHASGPSGYRFGHGFRVSGFNDRKFMIFQYKTIIYIYIDPPKERSSILLQGNPVTPRRGTMASKPVANATPMRAGDREASHQIKNHQAPKFRSVHQ
jgi:hypothetical protein